MMYFSLFFVVGELLKSMMMSFLLLFSKTTNWFASHARRPLLFFLEARGRFKRRHAGPPLRCSREVPDWIDLHTVIVWNHE